MARRVNDLRVCDPACSLPVWAYEHVKGNYEAGPLDRVYGEKWDSTSTVSRVWHAVNGSVGPAPLLASGALGLIGLLVFLSTMDHPVLDSPVLGSPVIDSPVLDSPVLDSPVAVGEV